MSASKGKSAADLQALEALVERLVELEAQLKQGLDEIVPMARRLLEQAAADNARPQVSMTMTTPSALDNLLAQLKRMSEGAPA